MKIYTLLLSLSSLICQRSLISGYYRKPCTDEIQVQFQLPDCYVPAMDEGIMLSSASFLMSHDSATGYIKHRELGVGGNVLSLYSKNQIGTAYDQLNDGVRAFDMRPKLLANGTVIFQHGDFDIPITLDVFLSDVVRWCSENTDELVLLLPSNLIYEEQPYDDGSTYVSAVSAVYKKYGVPYVHCTDVYGLTVGETMEMAALPTGGYAIAMDKMNYWGSFCGKSNWIEDQLVTCYSNNTAPCISGKKDSKPMMALQRYILGSANNEPTSYHWVNGPPSDLYEYPFNEIQAFWQVTVASAALGMVRSSNLIKDNVVSKVNEYLVDMIYEDRFDSINLFAVDNAATNGNALFSVLRTRCSQNDLVDCGQDFDKPEMFYKPPSRIIFWLSLSFYITLAGWVGYMAWMNRL